MSTRATHKRALTTGYISGDVIALCDTFVLPFPDAPYRIVPKLAHHWRNVTCKRCHRARRSRVVTGPVLYFAGGVAA